MSVFEEIKTSLEEAIDLSESVYVVKHYDIYDDRRQEYIIGVSSSYVTAVDIIKDEIKNIPPAFSCYRYSIEKWKLDKRYMSGLEEVFTKEQNIQWAKELGVYYD